MQLQPELPPPIPSQRSLLRLLSCTISLIACAFREARAICSTLQAQREEQGRDEPERMLMTTTCIDVGAMKAGH